MFTATIVTMLLLLQSPFLPLYSQILHLINADPIIEKTLNDLNTQLVIGMIF